MKKPRAISQKSLDNLQKAADFSKDNQPSCESKSKGQIEARKEFNVNLTLRTLAQSYDATKIAYESAIQCAKNGKPDSLIKLIGLAKEPEAQNINLNGGVEVQKVFIDEKTKKEVDKHVKDFIND